MIHCIVLANNVANNGTLLPLFSGYADGLFSSRRIPATIPNSARFSRVSNITVSTIYSFPFFISLFYENQRRFFKQKKDAFDTMVLIC
jgi:hypothetical protein